jgi:hypothetical protein
VRPARNIRSGRAARPPGPASGAGGGQPEGGLAREERGQPGQRVQTKSGPWAASSSRPNFPVATATLTAPAARADLTSWGVSPITTASAGATPSHSHALKTGSGAGRCSGTSSSQTIG